MDEWGWNITPEMEKAFQRIWVETDIDKDYSTRSFMESTNFFLGQWAYLIQNWEILLTSAVSNILLSIRIMKTIDKIKMKFASARYFSE